jgi:hypothetical protein
LKIERERFRRKYLGGILDFLQQPVNGLLPHPGFG